MSETTLQEACVAEVLQAALSPLFPGAVFPQVYKGPLVRYIVWNYSVLPTLWADSRPRAARYLVQVHFYLPHREDPRETLLAIERALSDAGFTWPVPTDASDSEGQHWVLECEYTDGGAFYGFA